MANCIGDGNLTNALNEARTSSPEMAVFFASLNICLSITASLGNSLILLALHKVSSVHPPTKFLFRCLALTDFCVGLISQPLFATILLNSVTNYDSNIYCSIVQVGYALGFILCGLSIFTSTAISVDRLLAIKLGLRYRHVVTLRRVRAAIIFLLVTGVSGGCMQFLWSYRITYTVSTVLAMLSVLTSTISYKTIFHLLQQRKNQVRGYIQEEQSNGQGGSINISRYRKTVSSIAWVQLTMAGCYTPFSVVGILATYARIKAGAITYDSALTLLLLNSSLNPLLYCWTIREVKQIMKDTVKQFCCGSSRVVRIEILPGNSRNEDEADGNENTTRQSVQ